MNSNEPHKDPLLNSLLQKGGTEKARSGVTEDIMQQIYAGVRPEATPVTYPPLIGKTGWVMIVLGVVAAIVSTIILFPGTNTEVSDKVATTAQQMENLREQFTLGIQQFSSSFILIFSILILGVFLVADSKLRKFFIR
jgi:hypothetical protein